MNEFDALRAITRRALRIDYISPMVCMNEVIISASGSSEISTLDIIPTLRAVGPASIELTSPEAGQVLVSWTPVSGAYAYIVYRATDESGPFSVQVSGTLEFSFLDVPPVPGTYFYKVTAIEPNFGETFPSPVNSITL